MSNHEERLDRYIDNLNAGTANGTGADAAELAGLFETVGQVHALRESDVPRALAAGLSRQLGHADNHVHSNSHTEPVEASLAFPTNPWARDPSTLLNPSQDDEPESRFRQIAHFAGAALAFTLFGLVLVLVFGGGEGGGLQPAAAPQAVGQIAFTADYEGNADIYLFNADGSGMANLTNHPSKDWTPSWSPDGSQIAFASDRDGHEQIYIMDGDGSNVRQLTDGATQSLGPVWSPDGQWIAFIRYDSRNDDTSGYLSVIQADGTDQRSLSRGERWMSLTWTPDSTAVTGAYVVPDVEAHLISYYIDGSAVQVYQPFESPAFADWSPDGRHLAVMSHEGNPLQPVIYVMDSQGTQISRLSADSEMQVFPAWSPDSQRISFGAQADGISGLYVATEDGSDVQELLNSPRSVRNLWSSWSPEGSQIAFVQSASSQNNEVQDLIRLMVVNADGSRLTELATDLPVDAVSAPVWRPTTSSTPVTPEPMPSATPSPTRRLDEPVATPSSPERTAVPVEPMPADPEFITSREAVEQIREFLGEPEALLGTEPPFDPSVSGMYQIMRPINDSVDQDSFMVDARTGVVSSAIIFSHTSTYAPVNSIDEDAARDLAESYAASFMPGFQELTLHEEHSTGRVPGIDSDDQLYSITWQLQSDDSGAWLPTSVTADINLDTGLLFRFTAISQEYDGPTAPVVTEEEATVIAHEHVDAVQDMQLRYATLSHVELATEWKVTETDDIGRILDGEHILAWLVWFDAPDGTNQRRHVAVDAISGDVLNPAISDS